uniref:Uncharacterized protein n=1 Tax=Noctiluca scintillans TaxID=2966 RepID=A0A7S1ANR2_NOCSC
MSSDLLEWLSRLPSISGDARKTLINAASRWCWDLDDFRRYVILASCFPQPLADDLTAFERAVVLRVWRSDFEDQEWSRGTFDFIGLNESQRRCLESGRTCRALQHLP